MALLWRHRNQTKQNKSILGLVFMALLVWVGHSSLNSCKGVLLQIVVHMWCLPFWERRWQGQYHSHYLINWILHLLTSASLPWLTISFRICPVVAMLLTLVRVRIKGTWHAPNNCTQPWWFWCSFGVFFENRIPCVRIASCAWAWLLNSDKFLTPELGDGRVVL